MSFKMDDYVDVAERIRMFYERFPEGRLTCGTPPQVVEIGGKPFIWYHARAYRTPDDPLPGDGFAAEPVPGPTQFTRDSELMNAETAAWGRAIVALGFETKKIASAQEVKARSSQAAAEPRRAPTPEPPPAGDSPFKAPPKRQKNVKVASADDRQRLRTAGEKAIEDGIATQTQLDSAMISRAQMSFDAAVECETLPLATVEEFIKSLEKFEKNAAAA